MFPSLEDVLGTQSCHHPCTQPPVSPVTYVTKRSPLCPAVGRKAPTLP